MKRPVAYFFRMVVRAMTALARVNTAIIQAMVHGVPSRINASSNEEIMPLPYCNEPIKVEADPVASGTASSAQAVGALEAESDRAWESIIFIRLDEEGVGTYVNGFGR